MKHRSRVVEEPGLKHLMEADHASLRGIAQRLNDDWWIDARLFEFFQ
jgi:hypothetical protein